MEKKRPLLTIRPKFDPGYAVVQALGATLGGFIVTTFVLGTVFFLLLSAIGLGRHVSGGGIYGFFMVVSLLGIPVAFYELKKRAYQRTIYNFYDDYIDFQYFHYYITRRRGRTRYTDIADLAQDASALQEHQRLHTIYIFIPGMAGMRQRQRAAFSGLKLSDLSAEKDYMTILTELIEARVAGLPFVAAAATPPGNISTPPGNIAPGNVSPPMGNTFARPPNTAATPPGNISATPPGNISAPPLPEFPDSTNPAAAVQPRNMPPPGNVAKPAPAPLAATEGDAKK